MPVEAVGIALLLALSGWIVLNGLRGGPQRPIIVSLLLTLTLGMTWQEVTWRAHERIYSHIAQGLAANPKVSVRCQRLSGAFFDVSVYDGTVQFDSTGKPVTWTHLTWDTCRNLTAYLRSDHRYPSLKQIQAVHVLAHESEHLKGTSSEAQAECDSVQTTARTAVALGATPEQGQALAERYFKKIYPNLRSDYISDECKPGGEGDRSPKDGQWP